MKLLLTTLNSKYVHTNLALKYLYCAGKEMAAGDGGGAEIELREFTINNDMNYVYGEIIRGSYDCVCFSCYIWNIEKVLNLTADLKKAQPSMKILLGGPEVSYGRRTLMENCPWIDYIIRGEGEHPFSRFCCKLKESSAWLSEGDLPEIPALTYRDENGDICETAQGMLLPMEEVPFPYKELPPEQDKVVYYESSRGCPYRCSYCLSSLDKSIRALPVEDTCRHLGFFLSQKVKQVKFIDRTFNFDLTRAKEIWQYLIEQDNGITNFHFELCGELLDDQAFSLLEKARQGLFQFEIGIQSCNDRTLAAVDRKEQVMPILDNVRRLIAMGNCHVHVDLIAGLPYEDYESFGRSFDLVYGLQADNLQLGFLKLLKGTKIRKETENYDYVFRSRAPYEVIANKYMGAEEMVRLKMIENVLDLYANKGGFEQSLDFLIEKVSDRPFSFFEKFADYFYDQGFQHRSHKKEDLYRILRKFAKYMDQEFSGILEHAEKLISQDLEETMNFDAVKKFYKKGWEING